jgi:putative NADH-flavin reductase
MQVTVFGSTGVIGSLVVANLRAEGHDVIAYLRDPSKIPATWDTGVTPVIGEITDASTVTTAIAGSGAVISALGPSMSRKAVGTPLVTGAEIIVSAMRTNNVTRYIGNGTPSVLDPREKPTWQTRFSTVAASTLLRRAYDEMVGMSKVIMESDLDWTIVRFSSPRNGSAKGVIREGFFGQDKLGMAITRADIAAFTAAQLTDDRYIRAVPAISN